mmetsp:Transcript_2377/g.5978  ORF Transcript_2377/g.5978 Transcript_2377/m.5978 type:complete len:220 (-) Transcript_2377:469-1128(-)
MPIQPAAQWGRRPRFHRGASRVPPSQSGLRPTLSLYPHSGRHIPYKRCSRQRSLVRCRPKRQGHLVGGPCPAGTSLGQGRGSACSSKALSDSARNSGCPHHKSTMRCCNMSRTCTRRTWAREPCIGGPSDPRCGTCTPGSASLPPAIPSPAPGRSPLGHRRTALCNRDRCKQPSLLPRARRLHPLLVRGTETLPTRGASRQPDTAPQQPRRPSVSGRGA